MIDLHTLVSRIQDIGLEAQITAAVITTGCLAGQKCLGVSAFDSGDRWTWYKGTFNIQDGIVTDDVHAIEKRLSEISAQYAAAKSRKESSVA